MLWITGEAGVGKSALAAWLCNKRPEIAAFHFCRFGNTDRVDARKALFSLAYQLSTQLPIYQDRLNASQLDKIVAETNVPAIFDHLFAHRLSDRVPLTDKPHVLLIDALDEATRNGTNELASLIRSEISRLPQWLRVIVTSRPHEQEINHAVQGLDPWTLDAGGSENPDDIRGYLRRELRPFTGNGALKDEVLTLIVEKSEGLFLYVSIVRDELQAGRWSLARVEEFPRGLGGVYADFFQRYFADPREFVSDCRPALEAICAVREPFERRDLAALLGWSDYELRSLTARLGPLFPVVDGRVRPFHQSVRDWLTDPERSGPYWIVVSAQERRLADLAWREYRDGVNTMGRYCITYGPHHLASCDRRAELKELLLDFDWTVAKIRTVGIAALLADYDLALDILSPKLPEEIGRPMLIPLGPSPQKTLEATAAEVDGRVIEDFETTVLRLIQGAIRLSAHVITKDPAQLASQMVGRLMPHQGLPEIKHYTAKVIMGTHTAWLQPLQATLYPAGAPLIRTLQGHSDGVNGVALSGDARRAISASSDRTLKVWDLESGRELRTLEGHSDSVNGVVLSADARRAISASSDKTLKVWDLESGRELHTVEGHSGAVHCVAVSVDGRWAVSGSEDKTLKVWLFILKPTSGAAATDSASPDEIPTSALRHPVQHTDSSDRIWARSNRASAENDHARFRPANISRQTCVRYRRVAMHRVCTFREMRSRSQFQQATSLRPAGGFFACFPEAA